MVNWTFNLDAAWGAFGFQNSLYRNNRQDPSGNLDDNWFEGFVKPALSGSLALGESELYGALSAVGERTYGAAPSLVGEDASSFKEEDLYIGWGSRKSLGPTENLVDLTVGRTQYKIGVGLGGDVDTNGGVAGALLGAVHGRDAVPPQWRAAILSCRAHMLLARRPRPMALWPCFALELAERLLVAGAAARRA